MDKAIAKDVVSTENLMELVESMDESQRQKVIALFKAAVSLRLMNIYVDPGCEGHGKESRWWMGGYS